MGFWSSIKKVVKKVANVVGGAVSGVWNGFGELFNRFFGGFGFILDLFVPWPKKKLRVSIKILRYLNGTPLHPSRDLTAESRDAFNLTKTIFKDSANVEIVEHSPIEVIESIPPRAALYPRCGAGGFADQFGEAGGFYVLNKAYSALSLFFGYGAPITVFVVKDVIGKVGCSNGPLTDYVTLDIDGLSDGGVGVSAPPVPGTTMAHELGHACSLLHRDATNNLMHKSRTTRLDTKLTRWQRAVLRNSKHVTIL